MIVPANRKGLATGSSGRESATLRMDLLENPHGPPDSVASALAGIGQIDAEAEAARLRDRLRSVSGFAPGGLLLGAGADALAAALARSRPDAPLVGFPPALASEALLRATRDREWTEVRRGPAFAPDVDQETASELPPQSVAYLATPHDPTGAIAQAQDLVRLARACSLVIVDERHGGFTPRTLVALAREFDNVVVIRSLETWAGLSAFPVAWAVGSSRALAQVEADLPAAGSLVAANAALDDIRTIEANARRVRDERARLYRMLRKLSIVQPLPSWAGFVLARTELGERDGLVTALADRGILVHRPLDVGLERCIRVSATAPSDTDALKRALVDITTGM